MFNNLKSNLTVAVMVMFGITALISCEKEVSPSGLNVVTDYSELAQMVNDDLESIGQSIRTQKITINSPDIVVSTAKQHYSEEPEAYNAFLSAYNKSINNSYSNNEIKSEVIKTVLDKIEIGLINSSSSYEFIDFLQAKFDEISTNDMKIENKDFLLRYIISYKASIEFIDNNLDIITGQNSQLKGVEDWWESWGRCAAGIFGAAGGGALGGAAAGSAVPGIGTGAGMVVGAISGALSGAAAAC